MALPSSYNLFDTQRGDFVLNAAAIAAILEGSGGGDVPVGDLILADGKIIIGSAGGIGVAQTPSGDVTMTNGGVTAIGAKKVTSAMVALADGTINIGGASGAAAARTLSGDVTVNNTGVTAIGAAKVTNAMLASGAGVGALLTAGLGASASYLKTANSAAVLLASDAGDRSVLIVVVVDEVFANGDGGQSTFQIGQVGTAAKFADTTAFTDAAAGAVFTFAGTLTGAANMIVTGVAATGTGTGGITVTVLALPAA